jgi:hypothetical protein
VLAPNGAFAFKEKTPVAPTVPAPAAPTIPPADTAGGAPAGPLPALSLPLAAFEFYRPELTLTSSNLPASEPAAAIHLAGRGSAWSELLRTAGPSAQVYLDPRSGVPTNIMAAIPMIPGDGVGNTAGDPDEMGAEQDRDQESKAGTCQGGAAEYREGGVPVEPRAAGA